MATDIAFVLGALALMGPGLPSQVRVFLLTLAIVDDIGAIVVIAIFYSEGIDLVALAAAGAIVVAIGLLGRVRVWRGPAYFVAGLALWVAMVESGVHPTIAGVLLGLLTPCTRRGAARSSGRRCSPARSARNPSPAQARSAMLGVGAAISPNERLQELLHPWTSYVVVPLFALANAGVPLRERRDQPRRELADHDRHRRRPRRGQDDRHRARVLPRRPARAGHPAARR